MKVTQSILNEQFMAHGIWHHMIWHESNTFIMECLIFHTYQNSWKIDVDIITCDKIILKISFYKISMMMSMLALV